MKTSFSSSSADRGCGEASGEVVKDEVVAGEVVKRARAWSLEPSTRIREGSAETVEREEVDVDDGSFTSKSIV